MSDAYTYHWKVRGAGFSRATLRLHCSRSVLTSADLGFIVPRVLELTYTAHDLKPWAEDLGLNGPPFGYDPVRRAQLRAELDAYYARLYGLTRDEESAFGEYRTGRLVLEAWDALAR